METIRFLKPSEDKALDSLSCENSGITSHYQWCQSSQNKGLDSLSERQNGALRMDRAAKKSLSSLKILVVSAFRFAINMLKSRSITQALSFYRSTGVALDSEKVDPSQIIFDITLRIGLTPLPNDFALFPEQNSINIRS